jgi:hypothetical protein
MSAIAQGVPFMAARLGMGEIRFLSKTILRRKMTSAELLIQRWIEGTDILWAGKDAWFREQLLCSTRRADEFLELYLAAMAETDVLGSWSPGESLFCDFFPQARVDHLRLLEPFRHSVPWSSALEGKRVLVVHPFSKSIQSQYEKARVHLFEDQNVLPRFHLSTLTPFMEGIREPDPGLDLIAQFHILRDELRTNDSDVVIIGAGPLGFLLGAEAKKMGRIAVHLGGATQLLFGITGKRWDESENFKFQNEFWIRPSREETPTSPRARYDQGAYW